MRLTVITMTFEIVVGLQIKDEGLYKRYRTATQSLLTKANGGFRYDFRVAETLKSESSDPINRVFVIYFQNRQASADFFANEEYLKAKNQFFEAGVTSTTIIAEYERPSEQGNS